MPRNSSSRFTSGSISSSEVEFAKLTPSGYPIPSYTDHTGQSIEACAQAAERLESHGRTRSLFSKKSQYYDEAFACRGRADDPRERVISDSVILAEMSFNNSIRVDNSFLNDFSFQLSEVYHRPASCIMVVITMQNNMILGGTFEPAYSVIISALPSEIAPTKNKRSTHFIQNFIFDALGIKPNRGVIRFEAVFEENLATNGMTALQEIEQLEKHSGDRLVAPKTVNRRKSATSKESSLPMLRDCANSSSEYPALYKTWTSKLAAPGYDGAKGTNASASGPRKVTTRKSIMNLFRK